MLLPSCCCVCALLLLPPLCGRLNRRGAPLQKKEVVKKTYEDKGRSAVVDEGPLDDPVAEKLRQQR
jgi:hypothetical protein